MENQQTYSHEDIAGFLEAKNFRGIKSCFAKMQVADISEIFSKNELDGQLILFRLVAQNRRAKLFSYLHFEIQKEMLDALPDLVSISLLNEMDPVDRTQLLEELPDEVRSKLIAQMEPSERKIAWQLLSYPEDSIGRMMSPEFISVSPEVTANDAIAHLRWNSAGIAEVFLHHIFVTDEQGLLKGHVSLSALVLADPGTVRVAEIMDEVSYALSAYDDEGEAVDHFRKYDRPYIPVVDDHYRLVGIVEADDVFDVAEEEATENIQAFGGQASLEDSYLQTPMFTLFKKRGSWLAMIFLMMMFTANVLEAYESTFAMKFLLIFLPLIISSGGNSGSQAASLIIRGIAVKEIELADWWRVLNREIIMGLALGVVLGALGFWRVVYVGGLDYMAGITIASSLMCVVLFGAIAGSMLPLLLKKMRLDPAVSSSPVIASLVDIFGIFTLFNIAIFIAQWDR